MAKSTSQMITALQKLYDKRAALDKQIIAAEKNLVAGIESAKTVVKAVPIKAGKATKKITEAVAVKKAAGRPRGRKPTNSVK